MSTYFIVGASRGIGLEFVKQLGANPANTVIVTVREEAKLNTIKGFGYSNIKAIYIDMNASLPGFEAAFQPVSSMAPNGIDVVIHNAAVMGIESFKPIPEQDIDIYADLYNINVIGVVKTYRNLVNILENQKKPFKYVIISSRGGSIGGMKNLTSAYGMSKAAVNHFARQLSIKYKENGNIVVPMHPGLVATDLTFGAPPTVTLMKPEESVKGMLGVIDKLTLEDSGKFWTYEGDVYEW